MINIDYPDPVLLFKSMAALRAPLPALQQVPLKAHRPMHSAQLQQAQAIPEHPNQGLEPLVFLQLAPEQLHWQGYPREVQESPAHPDSPVQETDFLLLQVRHQVLHHLQELDLFQDPQEL